MKNEYQMNPILLHFNSSEQESLFREHYFDLTIWQLRAALGLGFILYSLFAILDIWIVPEIKEITWTIRATVCSCYLLFFGYSFTSYFKKLSQISIAVIAFIGGFGIILMVSISDNLGNYLYFVGVILVINWTYVFSSLRFANAFITCLLIIIIYEVVAIGIRTNPTHILLNNTFFMLSGNIIAMFAGYMMEQHTRKSFFKNQIITSRTAAIKDLMDNTGQGFLSFNNDYIIHNEYSKACLTFFNKPIENLNVLELIFPDGKEETKQLFDLVFTRTANMSLIYDILPKEIFLEDRAIAVNYIWIEAQDHTQDKFLCILTDITKENKLKELLKSDEERNQLVLKVALDREGFIQFLHNINKLLERIFVIYDLPFEDIDAGELFRHYHTIKGGAASYSLKVVSAEAHAIESDLAEYRENNRKFSNETIENLKERTQKLNEILLNRLDDLSDVISSEELQTTVIKYYKVPENKVAALESILDHTNDIKKTDLLKAINSLRKQPVGPILKKFGSDAEQLAMQLGKQVNVELEGSDVEISHDRLNGLFSVLIHLVRNSVDHGIETTDIRSMLGKSETGTLIIKALKENEWLKFLITDDGGGIDDEAVRNIAISKGVITSEQAEKMHKNELVKLIFEPGFSTKEQVSDISGRGVGMDAVNTVVEELEGSIEITTELDQGTTFEIRIPVI